MPTGANSESALNFSSLRRDLSSACLRSVDVAGHTKRTIVLRRSGRSSCKLRHRIRSRLCNGAGFQPLRCYQPACAIFPAVVRDSTARPNPPCSNVSFHCPVPAPAKEMPRRFLQITLLVQDVNRIRRRLHQRFVTKSCAFNASSARLRSSMSVFVRTILRCVLPRRAAAGHGQGTNGTSHRLLGGRSSCS